MSSSANHAADPAATDHLDHAHSLAHPVSVKFMTGILVALLFLTVITVAVSRVDLGNANLFVAMFVASIKASLVALFFMHLFWDKPFNGLILVGSFLFLGIFIGFALLDTKEYQTKLTPMLEEPAQMQQFDPTE